MSQVGTALSGIWSQISELRELSWATVQPRKLRQQIDGLLTSTKEMPTRMRQYAAFEYVQDVLKGLLKSNMIVSELKSEALKDRHWKQLFKAGNDKKNVKKKGTSIQENRLWYDFSSGRL